MKRNFQFDDVSIVRWGDQCIDLHNAYDLERFATNRAGDEIEIRFKRNAHAIDPGSLPATVTLRCAGEARLAFNDLCVIMAPITNEAVEIAYFDEGCDWLSFLDEPMAQRQEPQGLHLAFDSGLVIRVFCGEAKFTVDDQR